MTNDCTPVSAETWSKFLSCLRARSRPVAALFLATAPGYIAGNGSLVIRLPRAFIDLAGTPAKKKIVAEEVARVFGSDVFPVLVDIGNFDKRFCGA